MKNDVRTVQRENMMAFIETETADRIAEAKQMLHGLKYCVEKCNGRGTQITQHDVDTLRKIIEIADWVQAELKTHPNPARGR